MIARQILNFMQIFSKMSEIEQVTTWPKHLWPLSSTSGPQNVHLSSAVELDESVELLLNDG